MSDDATDALTTAIAQADQAMRRPVGARRAAAGDDAGGPVRLGTTELAQVKLDGRPAGAPIVAYLGAASSVSSGAAVELVPETDRAPQAWRIRGVPCLGFVGVQSVYVISLGQLETTVVGGAPAYSSVQRLLPDGTYSLTPLKTTNSFPASGSTDYLTGGLTLGNRVYVHHDWPDATMRNQVDIYDGDTGLLSSRYLPTPGRPNGVTAGRQWPIAMVADEYGAVWVTCNYSSPSPATSPGTYYFVHSISRELGPSWAWTIGPGATSRLPPVAIVGPPGDERSGAWTRQSGTEMYAVPPLDIVPPDVPYLVNPFAAGTSVLPFDGNPMLVTNWCGQARVVDQYRVFTAASPARPWTLSLVGRIGEPTVSSPAYQAAFAEPVFQWRHLWGARVFGVLRYIGFGALGSNVNPFGAPTFLRPAKVTANGKNCTGMVVVELFPDGSVTAIWGWQVESSTGQNPCDGGGGAEAFYYLAMQGGSAELSRGVYRVDLRTGALTVVMDATKFHAGGYPLTIVANGRYR